MGHDMNVTLTLYNTQTRAKEIFTPLHKDHVGLYVCGPTVYDTAHIGNARPVVVFDVLFRLLSYLYPKVIYVRNITDVDDKIIQASRKNEEAIDHLTHRMTQRYHQDMAALNALPPTIEPRATLHIPHMIQVIEKLIKTGHAYVAEGHVLFAVDSYTGYGALSQRPLDDMIAGARVEIAPYKKQPHDFVLWKPAQKDDVGWESPWGFGRPGWHIECSAMSVEYLGQPFDIHGGGIDLVFPHHENERAQSLCSCEGKELARYWVHNGHLIVNGEKMSKSLGNFFTVHDKLKEMPGEVIRLVLLSTHYRQPLDWTDRAVMQARNTLDRFYQALRDFDPHNVPNAADITYDAALLEALCDDLNTPEALAVLHRCVADINRVDEPAKKQQLQQALVHNAQLLGILQQSAQEWFTWRPAGNVHTESLSDVAIQQLIDARNAARAQRDFVAADHFRDQLQAAGILLEDTAQGTQWRRG